MKNKGSESCRFSLEEVNLDFALVASSTNETFTLERHELDKGTKFHLAFEFRRSSWEGEDRSRPPVGLRKWVPISVFHFCR